MPSNDSNSLIPIDDAAAPRPAMRAPSADDPFGDGMSRASAVAEPPRASFASSPLSRMWRYRWTMILVALGVMGPGITAVVYSHKSTYRAAGEICVSPTIPRLVYRLDDNGPIPLYHQFVNSQVAILRSPAVLNRVLEMSSVKGTTWIREKKSTLLGEELTTLERMKESLEVKPRANTQVIDVMFAHSDPREAALIVNAVLEQYQIYVEEANRQEQDAILAPIQKQYNALRDSIEGHEQSEAALRGKDDAGSPETLYTQRSAELTQMEARRDDLRRQIKVAEMQVQDLAAAGSTETQSTPATQPVIISTVRYQFDPEWRRLYQEHHAAQTAVDEQRAWGLSDRNPKLVALLKRLEISKELLESRQEQLDVPAAAAAVTPTSDPARPDPLFIADPRARLTHLQREASTLEEDIQRKREQVAQTGELVRIIQREDEQLRQKREMFQDINRVKLQREFERNAPGSIRVQTLAFPPSVPSNSNRRLMMITLAGVGGLAAGAAAAYLRALFSRVISDGQDAVAESHTPFLGLVPWIPPHDGPIERDAWQHESIRVIRTLLIERLRKKSTGGVTVAITSAGPGVGKTMLAISLARSLASTGRRVLLIDADFRRPALASRMGVAPGLGLIRALRAGGNDVSAALLKAGDSLDILPAGTPIEHRADSELLADGRLAPLIERWRRSYDVILFDTSPVLAAADAAILARQTDGTIFAMREGRCLRPEVCEAVSVLRQSGGDMLGTVVLGSQSRRRYGYQYYYTDSIIVDSAPKLDAREPEMSR